MSGKCDICSEHTLECTCDKEFFGIVKQCELYDKENIRCLAEWHPLRKTIYRSAVHNQNQLMSQVNESILRCDSLLEIHLTKSAVINFLIFSLRKMISKLPKDQKEEAVEYVNEKLIEVLEDED